MDLHTQKVVWKMVSKLPQVVLHREGVHTGW